MKLCTFEHEGALRAGVVLEDGVVDLSRRRPRAAARHGGLPRRRSGRARGAPGPPRRGAASSLARAACGSTPRCPARRSSSPSVSTTPTTSRESGHEAADLPGLLQQADRPASTGPHDPIHRPRVSTLLDYEGELGFVVGRRCRHVPRARAHEVIAGYLVVNDVTVRDWQLRAPTMTHRASRSTPTVRSGPGSSPPTRSAIRTRSRIRTWVNGDLRQDSSTRAPDLRLLRADRTPLDRVHARAGRRRLDRHARAASGRMKPPRSSQPGDVVRVEIEGIGALENEVVPEPETTSLL